MGADARVRVRLLSGKAERAVELLLEVARGFGFVVTVTRRDEEDHVYLNVAGGGAADLGVLIGRHGLTLRALEYLVNVGAGRGLAERTWVVLDVDGYRERHTESLRELATGVARRVLQSGRPVRLAPMNAADRRIVHLAVREVAGVTSASEGEDPERRVVVSLDPANPAAAPRSPAGNGPSGVRRPQAGSRRRPGPD